MDLCERGDFGTQHYLTRLSEIVVLPIRSLYIAWLVSFASLHAQETEVHVRLQHLDVESGTLRAVVGIDKQEKKVFNLLKKDIPIHHVLGHALKVEDLVKSRRLALKVTGEDDVVAIRDDTDCIWGIVSKVDASTRTLDVSGHVHVHIPAGTAIKNQQSAAVPFEKLTSGSRVQIILTPDRAKVLEVRVGTHVPTNNPYTRIHMVPIGVVLKVEPGQQRLQYLSIANRNQLHELTFDKGTRVRLLHEGKFYADVPVDQIAPYTTAHVAFEDDTKTLLQIDLQMPLVHGFVQKTEDKGRMIWLAPVQTLDRAEPLPLRKDARIVLSNNLEGVWGHLEEKCQVMVGLAMDQKEVVYIKKVTPEKVLQIKVLADDWGGTPTSNIQAVCQSVANEIRAFVPRRVFDPIAISRSKESPIAIFGTNEKGERRVKLNVAGNYWAQFAYQFGHEFGHILSNYRAAKNPNLWFEECLCETAAIFAIERMSKSWRERPPYPNWKSYSAALEDYSSKYRRNIAKVEDGQFAAWFEKNQETLQKFDRAAFSVVAVHVLLPLLEKNPAHWESLNWLNQWDADKELTFAEYLADWRRRVPEAHKPFVTDIAKAFDIALREK